MDIAERGIGEPLPQLLLAGIDRQWIALAAPAGELQNDFVDHCLSGQTISSPGMFAMAVARPLGEFVVVVAVGKRGFVAATCGTHNIDALRHVDVRRAGRRFTT